MDNENCRLVEVTFEEMLRSDCKIICDHFTLYNSLIEYGINFNEPMLFNEFLQHIGNFLSPLNCKSLFRDGKWFIWTNDNDEIINKYIKNIT